MLLVMIAVMCVVCYWQRLLLSVLCAIGDDLC